MKALAVYSHSAGRGDFTKDLGFVRDELRGSFETLDFVCAFSKEEASRLYAKASLSYDVLIVCGGDGTFNDAVNALMVAKAKPVLGYINVGTLGDAGRNFGVTQSLRGALSIIKAGRLASFDVGEAVSFSSGGSRYFAFCAAYGVFSDIAYATPRQLKRRIGRLAYYVKAAQEAFQPENHPFHYVSPQKELIGKAPFFMVLNGRRIGGFPVNGHSSIDDGLFEVFLTRNGIFNGLAHYIRFSPKPFDVCSECSFSGLSGGFWCLDGEKGPQGDIRIINHPKALSIFAER